MTQLEVQLTNGWKLVAQMDSVPGKSQGMGSPAPQMQVLKFWLHTGNASGVTVDPMQAQVLLAMSGMAKPDAT
jgi:hypothetical protein